MCVYIYIYIYSHFLQGPPHLLWAPDADDLHAEARQAFGIYVYTYIYIHMYVYVLSCYSTVCYIMFCHSMLYDIRYTIYCIYHDIYIYVYIYIYICIPYVYIKALGDVVDRDVAVRRGQYGLEAQRRPGLQHVDGRRGLARAWRPLHNIDDIVYVCMYVCIYIYMYIHTNICVYIYI